MSFNEAQDLLALANMVAAHRHGVTLDDVQHRFGRSKRTAQRMLHALETAFEEVRTQISDDRRKRWTLPVSSISGHLGVTSEELLALDMAIRATREGGGDVEPLLSIRDKVVSLVGPTKAASLEVDYEALLEAQGFVTRPGPRPRHNREMEAVIAEALKGCLVLSFDYASGASGVATPRRVRPLGLRLGVRRYLVALPDVDGATTLKTYRLDRIIGIAASLTVFERPAWFELGVYCRKAFGAFEKADEYGPVAWHFTAAAAPVAMNYVFHPDQIVEPQPDGSLVVRFMASGHLEMAWYLYTWGDQVEVLEPEVLKAMVRDHRRSDFAGLP